MMFIPYTDNKKFDLEAGKTYKNGNYIPVFEVKVDKSLILEDQDKDLVAQEKQTVAVDGVNGEYIQVGSMSEVNTKGNWPKVFGDNDE